MYKTFNKDDISIRPIKLTAHQELTNYSSGVVFLSGISASNNTISASNWNTINVLFYNTECSTYAGYKSHFYQERNIDSNARLIAVPVVNTGEKIVPGTVIITDNDGSTTHILRDDASGNLYDSSSGSSYIKGNVFYYHGVFVLTNTGSIYQNFGINNQTNIRFKSTHHIYEHAYFCRIGRSEMNASTNPTYVLGSDSSSVSSSEDIRFTHSEFAPFITTIGLYDNENRLLAVARSAQPIYNDPEQDLNFLVRFDL